MCERNVTERVRNELELMTMKTRKRCIGRVPLHLSYRAVVCAPQTVQHRRASAVEHTAPRMESAEYGVWRTATPNYRVAMRSYLFSHSNRVISHYGVKLLFIFFPAAKDWLETHTT